MHIRFQSMSDYLHLNDTHSQSQLKDFVTPHMTRMANAPELKFSLDNLPNGSRFTQALDRLQKGQATEDDIKAIQTFLVKTTGANIGTSNHPEGIDGKFGPRTQNALDSFFGHYFSTGGMQALGNHHSIPQLQASFLPRGSASPALTFGDNVPATPSAVKPTDFKTDGGTTVEANTPGRVSGGDVFSSKADSIDNWFVPQYNSNIVAARGADCGPASVGMILKSHGFSNTNPGTVRRNFMGVGHNNATASQELARGIREGSGGQLKPTIIEGNAQFKNDPDAFLQKMRNELKAGKQVILLTKNMAKIKRGDNPSNVNGHYVVVQGITADGDIITADPGSRSYGKNRVFSNEVFKKSFAARQKEGMPNNLISVSR